MEAMVRQRGRPKGTGIDDRGTLLEIATLMRKDPELKPTTAIRRLGIEHESTIRRLRDKYTAFIEQQSQVQPTSQTETWTEHSPASVGSRRSSATHVAPLAGPTDAVRRSRTPKQQPSTSAGADTASVMSSGPAATKSADAPAPGDASASNRSAGRDAAHGRKAASPTIAVPVPPFAIQAFAHSLMWANLFAVHQAVLFEAVLRSPMLHAMKPSPSSCCPNCGA